MLVEPTYVPQLFDPGAWALLAGLAVSWVAVTSLGVALGLSVAGRTARSRGARVAAAGRADARR